MATTIKLKNGSGAPLAGDLVQGEPALDLTNKRLYTEDSGGTVIEVGTNPSTLTVDTDVLVVDATNNRVGIGTTGPEKPLDVTTSSTGESTLIRINNDATDGTAGSPTVASIEFGNSGTAKASIAAAVYGNDWLAFRTNSNTERMRIDASGNVGIGTASPTHDLTVGSTSASDYVIALRGGVGGFFGWDDSANTTIVQAPNTRSLSFQVNSDTFSAGTEAMRIDASGNVGIGSTNTSGFKLDVAGTARANNLVFRADTSTPSGDAAIFRPATSSLALSTNSTERMRIDASGNVNIYGTDSRPLAITSFDTVSNGAGWDLDATSSNGVVTMSTGGTERMRIDSGGHVLIGRSSTGASAADYGMNLYSTGIIYLFANAAGNDDIFRGHNSAGTNTSAIEADGDYIDLSDSRFKQNIVDAPSVINTIKSMPVRSFDWKDRSYGQTYGFVAQELNGICPEVVKVPESEEDVWGVRNSKVVPMLVKAVQEQQAMIEELKAEVAALKGA